jgi:hypothetical protein
MSARTVFRIAILLTLICLGVLLVAAAKTYDAVDGSVTDDDAACLSLRSDFRAA